MVNTLPDPHRLVGSRLEPIIKVLAAQPHILQTNLIRLSGLMLDTLATIKLRESSSAKFDKPVLDAKNGTILKDKDYAPIMCVPNSCRAKCLIKSSNKFRDELQMQNLLLEAERDHGEWKQKTAAYAQTITKLEVSLRKEMLKK